ncbi:hypothetical protein [Mesorhizobium sp.]|uniref:hypothetical protein n=1 Tax=Mesorhizobium sp. TaxID=1871066 RepID=UPI002580B60C|nr:hypothetical protein [Mesorhizobium sp.]
MDDESRCRPARSNYRACAVYILNLAKYVDSDGYHATVRRVEVSSSFWLSSAGGQIPSSRLTTFSAFDTQHNILVLVYPVKALTAKMIIMPAEVGAF